MRRDRRHGGTELDTHPGALAAPLTGDPWVGQSVRRVEDFALLTGRGRYIDDSGTPPGTLHAAILRSPHAHATIESIEASRARALPGVAAVLTGTELRAVMTSLVVGVKAPVECWPIALDRVRYVGEPVAIVVAADRYLAEDALDAIEVRYAVRPAVVKPLDALAPGAPVLHEGFPGNVASDRRFSYGDPDAAFATAAHRLSVQVDYPRSACTPIECYGVLANFQGPFSIHAVIARALKVPGNRLRLRTPAESGGSFGVKQGVFPYIVLIAAAARLAGRPVKWIEDRMEHLAASVSATNRATRLDAAVDGDGRILALAWDQVEDCGAHLRAPEPATLYRMHGNMTGAYAIRHVRIRNRVVVTNKLPTGLNRGFGGPQVYFPLERLVARIAATLGLGQFPVAMAAPICLNRNGNAITLSPALHEHVLRACAGDPGDPAVSAAALRRVIHQRREQHLPELVFATVYPFSMHSILLDRWFKLAGIDSQEDLQLTVLPPQFMVTGIERGLIDGFCAGAPWNALAVADGSGVIVHPGIDIFGDALEKVLVWRAADIERRAEQVTALNRAIVAASHWCADPANWPRLASDLAMPGVLGASGTVIQDVLGGRIPVGGRASDRVSASFMRLDPGVLRPRKSDADFLYQCMQDSRMASPDPNGLATARGIFRDDIFDRG